MKPEIVKILEAVAPLKLAEGLVDSFISLESAFVLKQWKSGGLDAGHFVEMVRRFLDHVLLGSSAPVGVSLPALTEDELKRIAGRAGHESYRLLIPRVLFSIYGLRNKRGIGHVSEVAANGMDAALILASCKWVVAEIVRVSSNLSTDETTSLVERLSERYIDGFWSEEGIERILHTGLTVKEQILFYLFNRSPAGVEAIQGVVGSPIKYIRKSLREMDKARLVHFDEEGHRVILLPTGHRAAEVLIQSKGII